MSQERYGRQVDRVGLKTFPAVLVYGKDGSSLKLLGQRAGPSMPQRRLAWLASLPIGPNEASASSRPGGEAGVSR